MKKSILFLEDEVTIAEVTTEYMLMKGYDVTWVENGQIAIDTLNTQNFDLIILDIMVPEITGLEVLAHIHQIELHIPVIMLSALGDETTQLQAFNLFADDYIIKPFSPLLLLKRIEALLRRTQSPTQEKFLENEFVVDSKTYQAYYQQKSLQLTMTEFLLLQQLSSYPDQVFTREQLLNHIFPDDYYPNDRIIDAHVKNLRKKLPQPYIKTIMGIGYQFNPGGEK